MRGVVFATTAMPVYWVGLLLIWIVSIKLDLLPTSGHKIRAPKGIGVQYIRRGLKLPPLRIIKTIT